MRRQASHLIASALFSLSNRLADLGCRLDPEGYSPIYGEDGSEDVKWAEPEILEQIKCQIRGESARRR